MKAHARTVRSRASMRARHARTSSSAVISRAAMRCAASVALNRQRSMFDERLVRARLKLPEHLQKQLYAIARLIDADAGILDQLAPFGNFGIDDRRKFFGCTAD